MKIEQSQYKKFINHYKDNLEIKTKDKGWQKCYYPPKLKELLFPCVYQEGDIVEIYAGRKYFALRPSKELEFKK